MNRGKLSLGCGQCGTTLQNKHGKSTEISRKKCRIFPGFPRILKSVVNDESSAESMEIMIQLNVCHESAKKVENTERVEHNFGSIHGVTESAERVGKRRVQSVEISRFPQKTWKISQRDLAEVWKVWQIKICILDNAITSNFISVDAYGRGEVSTKDSVVCWSSLVPFQSLSFP